MVPLRAQVLRIASHAPAVCQMRERRADSPIDAVLMAVGPASNEDLAVLRT